jgi:hypothetical protein
MLYSFGENHVLKNSMISETYLATICIEKSCTSGMLELLHTHLGFIFPKVIPCLLVIISHYPVSYILGENISPGEYSLSVDTSV